MEVGTLVRVPTSPPTSPDRAGAYRIPKSIQGGTYQALVDSGCNQTTIHQCLIQDAALERVYRVKVQCVNGDVHNYPVLPITIEFRGKKHSVKAAVSPHLTHPLILGTNWMQFRVLVKALVENGPRSAIRKGACAALEAGRLPHSSVTAPERDGRWFLWGWGQTRQRGHQRYPLGSPREFPSGAVTWRYAEGHL